MPKRYFRLTSVLLCLFVYLQQGAAQDVHFSHYYSFPMAINPALTGNYEGNFRVGAIYRSQWGQILNSGDGFLTPGAFVDVPLLEGVLKRDKLGVGMSFYNDISGPALNNLHASMNLAYHKGIGREAQHRISLGAQVEFVQWRVDPNRLTYMDQFDNASFSAGVETGEALAGSALNYFNYNFGVYWKTMPRKRFSLQTGFAVFNLAEPEETFTNSSDFSVIRPTRYLADFGFDVRLGERHHISPDVYYSRQLGSQEITFGMFYGIYFNDGFRNKSGLHFGARYRWEDAIIPMLAVEVKNLRIGFAYDMTISDLSDANGFRGAYEISLVYIGESIRSFKVNKSLPCRRF